MARTAGAVVQPSGSTNAPELIKRAMKTRGYTQQMMADELGYARANGVGMAISGRNMRIDILVRMLDVLGFDVIVKDRNGSNRENAWKLEFTPDGGDAE